MVTLHLRVTLPEALYAEFLQLIRDFDTKHDPHHHGMVKFETIGESDFPAEELAELMRNISPPTNFMYVGKRK